MWTNQGESVFMGMDMNLPRGKASYVILNKNQRILTHGVTALENLDTFIQSTAPEIIALTSPISLSNGCMADPEFRNSLSPAPAGSRYQVLRFAEYELITHGLPVTRTPSSYDDCSTGTHRSLKVVSTLGLLGYQPFGAESRGKTLVEIPPDAWFQQLLGCKPFSASSLEGRIQRQLALQTLNLNVPDAMEFFEEVTRHRLLRSQLPENILLSTSILNAAAAAYTASAVIHNPQRLCRFGSPDEGYLFVPSPVTS